MFLINLTNNFINPSTFAFKFNTSDLLIRATLLSKLGAKLIIFPFFLSLNKQEDRFIKTLNFADKYNFEPISSIASDDDSFENVFNSIVEINDEIAKQYLLLVWFDCLVNNVDRHNENCGLLRDKKNGKIISLAPNFDNNVALISRSEVLNLNAKDDGLIKMFAKFIKNNKTAYELYREIKLPKLTKQIIHDCFKQIDIKKDKELIMSFLLNRYKELLKI